VQLTQMLNDQSKALKMQILMYCCLEKKKLLLRVRPRTRWWG